MLIAREARVDGRHSELLPATSLTAEPDELTLVVGETVGQRTTASLVLSGRMRTDGGSVAWGRRTDIEHLRTHVGLIDAAGINEPERHQRVRSVIAEDLALLPRPVWKRPSPRDWSVEHGHDDIYDLWIEQLDYAQRTRLLIDLALAEERTHALVVDSPDRHTSDVELWTGLLREYAQRGLAVVAVAGAVPDGWSGPLFRVGNAAHEAATTDTNDDDAASDEAHDDSPAIAAELNTRFSGASRAPATESFASDPEPASDAIHADATDETKQPAPTAEEAR